MCLRKCTCGLVHGRGELCVGQGSRQGGGICVRVSTQGEHGRRDVVDGVEVSTFESQPALSHADTSCFAEECRAEEAQSVFESNPAARVADVSSTTVEEGTSGEPSVFESTPAPSFAAMRCSEEVVAENAGSCTFESCPAKSSTAVTWETQVTEASDGQSVFENQPLVSRVDTSCHGEQIRTEEVQSVLKPRGCLAAGRHPQDIARLVPTRLAEESAGDSRDTRTGCGEGGGVLSSRDPRRGLSHRHQSQIRSPHQQ